MTTLAILSDVHGNSVALQSVLADLDAWGAVDQIIMLGDLVVFGPDPCGVIAMLQERKSVLHLAGNTDRYLVEKQYPGGSAEQKNWQAQVLASFPWTAEQLGEAGLQFLADLPAQHLLDYGQDHTILAVHGSPRSDEENILPETPDQDLAAMLGDLVYNLLLCAHTHIPLDRVVAGRRVVNAGSVGLPFDGDRRASYALIQLQPGGKYRVEFRRVAYKVEATVDQLFTVGHPATAVASYNLRTARPISRELIYTDQMRHTPALENLQPKQQNETGRAVDLGVELASVSGYEIPD